MLRVKVNGTLIFSERAQKLVNGLISNRCQMIRAIRMSILYPLPSYTTLSSLEIKSATEPVPRLEAETQFRETSADDLNALVRQLQRE